MQIEWYDPSSDMTDPDVGWESWDASDMQAVRDSDDTAPRNLRWRRVPATHNPGPE